MPCCCVVAVCCFCVLCGSMSVVGRVSALTEKLTLISHCKQEKGFPELLRDTLRYLGLPGYPEYHGEASPRKSWMVTLYIRENPALEAWRARAVGQTFHEVYRITAREAIQKLCATYHGAIQSTPMRYFPPQNKCSPAWIKRTSELPVIKHFGDPTIAYLAYHLHFLDDEYDRLSLKFGKLIVAHGKQKSSWPVIEPT